MRDKISILRIVFCLHAQKISMELLIYLCRNEYAYACRVYNMWMKYTIYNVDFETFIINLG